MSAWASGSLAEKLKQQKLAAPKDKGPVAPSATLTSSEAESGSSNVRSNVAPSSAPLAHPPAVDKKPVASTVRDKSPPRTSAALAHLGPIALPPELAKLVSAEFNFVGVVPTPPTTLEETRHPSVANGPETTPRPTAFAAQPEHKEPPQTADASHLYPVHHHHHYHKQQQQPRLQHQSPGQHHLYQYQAQQPQQRYMQQDTSGQSYHSAYNSVPYHMSPDAMPYRPRMYKGYPGMNMNMGMGMGMGMGLYGGMNEYGGFSLQRKPAYYPPLPHPMGPYPPTDQH
ncbi:hypothetical protein TraAM80_02553 [Trypanosoma rangeli]|uniref:Uncharacterized protein n=1 Tax=Trypanosoma rangeli TaxID=5698 RepID=A0A3R7KLF0_TRYRA|nr:uncharacterized protein TraAM80_02553 [Trypanosoma rangeli]RNF08811.1 hypothetical protein TraAM80_02553 [Trypanosoma rangeli]|eukprot:RNF08811.1 hypothetical protein TraAM80_02553 [Trypanosoma rangeli]